VNSILEDRKGNLWFGTTGEGVYKFDGKNLTQYTMANGLRSNKTYCLFESSKEKIWVGTDDGLYTFNESRSTFEDVHISNPINSLHNKFSVFSILEDTDGKLWFATVEGVFVYDGKSFELFIVDEDKKGFMSSSHNTEYMLQDKNGNMWFGSRVNDGVYRYDGETISNFKLEDLDGHKWAWPALQDKKGNIWFSNWGGTYRYDGTSFTSFTKEDGLCSKTIARIIEDSQGNIWFGGGEGLCRYDGKSFTHFTTKDGLPHNGVWSIFEDKSQNIWIGTKNNGLCMYNWEKIINP
jgi:ligand-binding sensor domain-containing protein